MEEKWRSETSACAAEWCSGALEEKKTQKLIRPLGSVQELASDRLVGGSVLAIAGVVLVLVTAFMWIPPFSEYAIFLTELVVWLAVAALAVLAAWQASGSSPQEGGEQGKKDQGTGQRFLQLVFSALKSGQLNALPPQLFHQLKRVFVGIRVVEDDHNLPFEAFQHVL